ncbi:NASP-related protein sim3 [Penicillium rolfsii]|nr:NASP-related protein sim3 [Penicillium rolfsii]
MAETEQPAMASQTEADKRAQLDDLITRAAAKDATKDHNAASELYSQATELQAELNGELNPENADLLYAYGKSLYNVAVSKSDVLGSKVAGEPSNAPAPKATSAKSAATGGSLVKDAISSSMNQSAAKPAKEVNTQLDAAPSKPFFQFTGDENFVDSEDEDEEENGEEEGEEEEDDFENAFEVLDLARVLYLKKLEVAEESSTDKGKGKSEDLPADLKHIKERLADTYDLQAEISLEGERFSDAVNDLRTALDLRNSLFPFEDPSVAECHYKLSLALEFASVQRQGEEDDGQEKTVDEEMRKEAATQMERAIESCKARMVSEEKKLESGKDMDEDKVTAAKRRISNVKEIIADMEQRLIDLRRSPVSIEEKEHENEAMLKGILGQIVGQSATDQKARLDAVSKEATDLSSLVRRKPAAPQSSSQPASSKRPADDVAAEGESKRARVEDA